MKQMKIIHQNGYSVDELSLYRVTIYRNVVDCARALISAMRQFNTEPSSPDIMLQCDFLWSYVVDGDPGKTLPREVGEAIVAIYSSIDYNMVMEHQSEFYMMDSAP